MDRYAVADLPPPVREALQEYDRDGQRIRVRIRPASACGKDGACLLGTLYRLRSGALLYKGHRHSLVYEQAVKPRTRRQHVAAVWTADGWLASHGGAYVALGCKHRDVGFLHPDLARATMQDVADGTRRAGKPLLITPT